MPIRTAQWKWDYQFNAVFEASAVTFVNTEVSGSGSGATVQLERETDNDNDIDYNSVGDYTLSDSAKITVDQDNSNKAKLKQLGGTSETYPFTTPSNYTYDSAKIKVDSGKASLLSELAAGGTFYADYNTDIDGTLGDGDLTGTATGGADVSGGKLDLAHNDVRYVTYDANLNADSQQVGCFRMLFTPNYSGTPASSQAIMRVAETSGSNNNEVAIFHQAGTGELRFNQRNSSGTTQVSFGAVWSPTSGVEYELELNYDLTTGNCRIFIDGVLHSSDLVTTGTRSADIGEIRIGSNRTGVLTSNFKLDNVVVFNAVQHTVNYTPGEGIIVYPTDDPDIVNNTGYVFTTPLDTFTMVSTEPANTGIKLHMSNDNGVTWKWWNGAAWTTVTGGQTNSWYYSNESNLDTVININIGSLAASGTLKVRPFLHTTDNQVTPELDSIYVAEPLSFSTDDNLYIDTKDASQIAPAVILEYLTATITNNLPANTDIKLLLSNDGRSTWLGWGGSSWDTVTGNTLRANASTIAEVQNNITSLSPGNDTFDVRLFLYSSDSSVSPDVDNINITSSTGYKTSGHYISTLYVPFEMENGLYVDSIAIDKTVPSGTTAEVTADFLRTNVLDPRNSNFLTYDDGDSIDIEDARWIQWRVDFTSDGLSTPSVNLVEIYFWTGLAIQRLLQKNLSGRWKIENNQMTIYDTDGTTALYTFNLLDSDGNPAQANVFERVPV